MVERCVRDAEVACSNHVASILSQNIRPVGQAVKTTPSHGVNPGSIPGQVTEKRFEIRISFFFFCFYFLFLQHSHSPLHIILTAIEFFQQSPCSLFHFLSPINVSFLSAQLFNFFQKLSYFFSLAFSSKSFYTIPVRWFWEECGFARIAGVRSHTEYPGNTRLPVGHFYFPIFTTQPYSQFHVLLLIIFPIKKVPQSL